MYFDSWLKWVLTGFVFPLDLTQGHFCLGGNNSDLQQVVCVLDTKLLKEVKIIECLRGKDW